MTEITTVGLDLAKSVFQVHAADRGGTPVARKKLRRGQVLVFFAGLPPCLIGLEACASSHYWARALQALGHEVRLILAAAHLVIAVSGSKKRAPNRIFPCLQAERDTLRRRLRSVW